MDRLEARAFGLSVAARYSGRLEVGPFSRDAAVRDEESRTHSKQT